MRIKNGLITAALITGGLTMQAQNTQAPPANIKKATPVLTVDPNTNRSFTLPANATKQPQVPADTGQSKNVLQGNAPKKQ